MKCSAHHQRSQTGPQPPLGKKEEQASVGSDL